MKLLIFADVHGSTKALREIKEKAKRYKPDILISAGDITIFEQNIGQIMSGLDKTRLPILSIHGNHECEEVMDEAEMALKNVMNVHKHCLMLYDTLFIGYGGGGFSKVDKEFEKFGKEAEKKIKELKPKNIVLITHAPPYGTKIDKMGGEHCGNKSIRRFIDRVKPDLVVSGHLHETAEKEQRIGNTWVTNPGPYGKIIEL